MKIKFQYVLREEYEGDEGVYVPTLGWGIAPYKNQAEGFDAYLRGDEDFLDFISSIDNLELISEALLKIESILKNQRKEIIFLLTVIWAEVRNLQRISRHLNFVLTKLKIIVEKFLLNYF